MLWSVGLSFLSASSAWAEAIRVFTWQGYVQPEEIVAVNQLLKSSGYDYEIEVITPWAEGPEQMFNVIRSGRVDISFLTLNYLKMQDARLLRLLQPINTQSPRLNNYHKLLDILKTIPMGMQNDQVYYIPWAGGAYGIWADMNKVSPDELPASVNELWAPRWKGHLSLSSGQIQPNIALTSMALGKTPFYLNSIQEYGRLRMYLSADSDIQQKLNQLYQQVSHFWNSAPQVHDSVELIASYGPGVSDWNANGGNWRLLNLKEGNTVWLDTINFHKDLSGKKLEAAEIFANYFIGKVVQNRAVLQLGLVAASEQAVVLSEQFRPGNFFQENMFWPPYWKGADNVMKSMSEKAMRAWKLQSQQALTKQ